jgi:hypothetical protein
MPNPPFSRGTLLPVAPVLLLLVPGPGALTGQEPPSGKEVGTLDAERLEEGVRRYELFVQGTPLGSAEYRLEREGEEWVSTARVTSMAGSQETVLRFGAADFRPVSLRQEQGQGPLAISVALEVEGERVRGRVELPPRLGETRDYDDELTPGTLLPGMDEYALALASLGPGTRLVIPYLDVTRGSVIRLEATVTGEEEVSVVAGTFRTWRVEVTGGEGALALFLRREPPHILIRQEFVGQPVRLDLSGMAPLPLGPPFGPPSPGSRRP